MNNKRVKNASKPSTSTPVTDVTSWRWSALWASVRVHRPASQMETHFPHISPLALEDAWGEVCWSLAVNEDLPRLSSMKCCNNLFVRGVGEIYDIKCGVMNAEKDPEFLFIFEV